VSSDNVADARQVFALEGWEDSLNKGCHGSEEAQYILETRQGSFSPLVATWTAHVCDALLLHLVALVQLHQLFSAGIAVGILEYIQQYDAVVVKQLQAQQTTHVMIETHNLANGQWISAYI
jgi:hypothetical protein